MPPKVSICVPNLNTRPYLPERFDTIFSQTFQDWECIVFDNHSDDGSWEYIQSQARKDSRLIIAQAPREGLYPNWNNCIRRATGEYIYIATSDDAMAPDFLEKTVAALDAHPGCGVAHATLRSLGDSAEEMNRWWLERSLFASSSGSLLTKPHIRRAPFDGLLHLHGDTVYISITQLLIRKSLFDRIGLFESRWGSIGDFHWNMRAGLSTDTIHVPDTWGGWRIHPTQATSKAGYGTRDHRKKIEEMTDDALVRCAESLSAQIKQGIRSGWRNHFRDRWEFLRSFEDRPTRISRAKYLIGSAISGSPLLLAYLAERCRGNRDWSESPGETVREWLESVGVHDSLKAL